MTHVPYRGAAPAATDIMAGRIDFLFTSYISIGEAAKGGKLRIIAIGGQKRIDAAPEIPTMAEAGYPGLDLEMWHGMVAPAGTPAPIVKQAQRGVHQGDARARKSCASSNRRRPTCSSARPSEFGKRIADDTQRLAKVIRDANIAVK